MNNNLICNFEDLIKDQYSNIAGIAVIKNENLIYEKYFDGYTYTKVYSSDDWVKASLDLLGGKMVLESLDTLLLELIF